MSGNHSFSFFLLCCDLNSYASCSTFFSQNHSVTAQTRSIGCQSSHQHPFSTVITLLRSAGTTSQSGAHEQTLCFFFFPVTVKGFFVRSLMCCFSTERKHKLTAPYERTPSCQPTQSGMKKSRLLLESGRVPTCFSLIRLDFFCCPFESPSASSSPSYFQPL